MESRVEDCHLRHLRHQGLNSLYAGDVGRIVQRSHCIALLHFLYHLGGDENRRVELLHAMHHTVAHSLYLVEALHYAFFRVGEQVEDVAYCILGVLHGRFYNLFRPVLTFVFQERIRKAYLLHSAFGKHLFGVGVDEFVFHAAASAVQYQNFHDVTLVVLSNAECPGVAASLHPAGVLRFCLLLRGPFRLLPDCRLRL